MAEPRLSSDPLAPAVRPPVAPAVSAEAAKAPNDAKGEFLAILQGESTPGAIDAAAKIESALASAPNDAARVAMRTEMRANARALRGCMQMEDDAGLVALVEKILAEASRTADTAESAPARTPEAPKSSAQDQITTSLKDRVSYQEGRENIKTLIAKFGSPESIADSAVFKRDAARIAAITNPEKRQRETEYLQAKVILQDADFQKKARANFASDADFNRSLDQLQAMFPDIQPIRPPRPANPTKYETELMRRAGANAGIPPTQAGNRITFATNETKDGDYVKMTMDVSHEPPTVMRHGPNGTLIPVNLEWNRSFDRAYGLMRATESLAAELENLRSRRDQLVSNAEKIGESLGVKADRTKSSLETVDAIIEQAEAKLNQDKQGNPPKAGALDSALAGALEGGDVQAMKTVEASTPAEAMRGAERFMTELKSIREEVAKLEEGIRTKEEEKLRLDAAKTVADEEFARHLKEADANAQANMRSLGDSGADLLGNGGVRKLVELLNLPNVRATIPHAVEIDFSKPLHEAERLYIARGMEKLFGADSGLYDETGALRQEAADKRDGLRDQLRSRGILDDVGEVRPFVLESVFLTSLTQKSPEIR